MPLASANQSPDNSISGYPPVRKPMTSFGSSLN